MVSGDYNGASRGHEVALRSQKELPSRGGRLLGPQSQSRKVAKGLEPVREPQACCLGFRV